MDCNGSLLGPFFFQGNFNGQDYLNLMNESVVPAMTWHNEVASSVIGLLEEVLIDS